MFIAPTPVTKTEAAGNSLVAISRSLSSAIISNVFIVVIVPVLQLQVLPPELTQLVQLVAVPICRMVMGNRSL